ncbi:GTP cyclohydrolase I [Microvirga thermotolerans]|uniref:GTP cyclohydrolase I n=1 Tax=Microvirga thermotolerans TaxID=2651334 RepID=A0A5P9JUI5_9HYPH|nr:GTP cyclohydrolase I [Microvirga thermotolerans]QFU14845.1 GTP cyclohydrolase I [Microvirga thermotolerans]
MNFHPREMTPPRLCNEALSEPLGEAERSAMIAAAAKKVEELFDVLRIDHRNDHNTRETPMRVAKMFVEEILEGRYTAPPRITEFDNVQAYDQLIVTGPIEVRSMCAHHLMPIYGHAYIGILPAADGKIIGLSKYDRIVEHFAARLQIQEEMVKQIGQYILDMTRPRGLAVRISAVHMCKTQRGVRASRRSRMVNTYYWGDLSTDAELKREFIDECTTLDRGQAD